MSDEKSIKQLSEELFHNLLSNLNHIIRENEATGQDRAVATRLLESLGVLNLTSTDPMKELQALFEKTQMKPGGMPEAEPDDDDRS